jgi:hypothetical protein
MAENRMLRGAAPLTIVRGAGTPSSHVYRGQLVDPNVVDAADRERLVGEGYLEWVVADGESWKLAESTATGEAGDPVSVGTPGSLGAESTDPGTVNGPATPTAGSTEAQREAARAKLPEDGSAPDLRSGKDVLVEYLASRGYAYDELVAQDRAALVDLVKSQSQQG